MMVKNENDFNKSAHDVFDRNQWLYA